MVVRDLSVGLRIYGEPFDQQCSQSVVGTDVHASLLMPEKYVISMTLKAY
jgi:hypothetical protein